MADEEGLRAFASACLERAALQHVRDAARRRRLTQLTGAEEQWLDELAGAVRRKVAALPQCCPLTVCRAFVKFAVDSARAEVQRGGGGGEAALQWLRSDRRLPVHARALFVGDLVTRDGSECVRASARELVYPHSVEAQAANVLIAVVRVGDCGVRGWTAGADGVQVLREDAAAGGGGRAFLTDSTGGIHCELCDGDAWGVPSAESGTPLLAAASAASFVDQVCLFPTFCFLSSSLRARSFCGAPFGDCARNGVPRVGWVESSVRQIVELLRVHSYFPVIGNQLLIATEKYQKGRREEQEKCEQYLWQYYKPQSVAQVAQAESGAKHGTGKARLHVCGKVTAKSAVLYSPMAKEHYFLVKLATAQHETSSQGAQGTAVAANVAHVVVVFRHAKAGWHAFVRVDGHYLLSNLVLAPASARKYLPQDDAGDSESPLLVLLSSRSAAASSTAEVPLLSSDILSQGTIVFPLPALSRRIQGEGSPEPSLSESTSPRGSARNGRAGEGEVEKRPRPGAGQATPSRKRQKTAHASRAASPDTLVAPSTPARATLAFPSTPTTPTRAQSRMLSLRSPSLSQLHSPRRLVSPPRSFATPPSLLPSAGEDCGAGLPRHVDYRGAVSAYLGLGAFELDGVLQLLFAAPPASGFCGLRVGSVVCLYRVHPLYAAATGALVGFGFCACSDMWAEAFSSSDAHPWHDVAGSAARLERGARALTPACADRYPPPHCDAETELFASSFSILYWLRSTARALEHALTFDVPPPGCGDHASADGAALAVALAAAAHCILFEREARGSDLAACQFSRDCDDEDPAPLAKCGATLHSECATSCATCTTRCGDGEAAGELTLRDVRTVEEFAMQNAASDADEGTSERERDLAEYAEFCASSFLVGVVVFCEGTGLLHLIDRTGAVPLVVEGGEESLAAIARACLGRCCVISGFHLVARATCGTTPARAGPRGDGPCVFLHVSRVNVRPTDLRWAPTRAQRMRFRVCGRARAAAEVMAVDRWVGVAGAIGANAVDPESATTVVVLALGDRVPEGSREEGEEKALVQAIEDNFQLQREALLARVGAEDAGSGAPRAAAQRPFLFFHVQHKGALQRTANTSAYAAGNLLSSAAVYDLSGWALCGAGEAGAGDAARCLDVLVHVSGPNALQAHCDMEEGGFYYLTNLAPRPPARPDGGAPRTSADTFAFNTSTGEYRRVVVRAAASRQAFPSPDPPPDCPHVALACDPNAVLLCQRARDAHAKSCTALEARLGHELHRFEGGARGLTAVVESVFLAAQQCALEGRAVPSAAPLAVPRSPCAVMRCLHWDEVERFDRTGRSVGGKRHALVPSGGDSAAARRVLVMLEAGADAVLAAAHSLLFPGAVVTVSNVRACRRQLPPQVRGVAPFGSLHFHVDSFSKIETELIHCPSETLPWNECGLPPAEQHVRHQDSLEFLSVPFMSYAVSSSNSQLRTAADARSQMSQARSSMAQSQSQSQSQSQPRASLRTSSLGQCVSSLCYSRKVNPHTQSRMWTPGPQFVVQHVSVQDCFKLRGRLRKAHRLQFDSKESSEGRFQFDDFTGNASVVAIGDVLWQILGLWNLNFDLLKAKIFQFEGKILYYSQSFWFVRGEQRIPIPEVEWGHTLAHVSSSLQRLPDRELELTCRLLNPRGAHLHDMPIALQTKPITLSSDTVVSTTVSKDIELLAVAVEVASPLALAYALCDSACPTAVQRHERGDV